MLSAGHALTKNWLNFFDATVTTLSQTLRVPSQHSMLKDDRDGPLETHSDGEWFNCLSSERTKSPQMSQNGSEMDPSRLLKMDQSTVVACTQQKRATSSPNLSRVDRTGRHGYSVTTIQDYRRCMNRQKTLFINRNSNRIPVSDIQHADPIKQANMGIQLANQMLIYAQQLKKVNDCDGWVKNTL